MSDKPNPSDVVEPATGPALEISEGQLHWSLPKEARVPVVVRSGRVNFRCLAETCPTPCCGPFSGTGQAAAPCFVDSFADLYLLDEDVDRLMAAGRGDLIEQGEDGYKLRLRPDTSCAAFDRGLCTIHTIRPAICRAFPFDLDLFAGLVLITKCPGVNAGWSEPDAFSDAVDALGSVYRRWVQVTTRRVRAGAATATNEGPIDDELPRPK